MAATMENKIQNDHEKLGENPLKAEREQQSRLIMISTQTQYDKTTLTRKKLAVYHILEVVWNNTTSGRADQRRKIE